jgi:hypothetical protein
MYKFSFTSLSTMSKESHVEVLMLSQILDVVNISHYFAIDFECHSFRGPLNIVVIEALMILNGWFSFPFFAHDAASFS